MTTAQWAQLIPSVLALAAALTALVRAETARLLAQQAHARLDKSEVKS